MYRLFVAIDLPENIRDRLLSLCYGLQGARWLDGSRLHLTLRFIGEVDGGRFRDVQDALATVATPPFELTVKGVGFFPPRNRPESLWAGIDKSDALTHLQKRVESVLTRAGLPVERRKFMPHIQLAKVKDCTPADIAGFLRDCALLRLGPFEVIEFCLYSSFLSSEKALHEIEAVYPLIGHPKEAE
jgi:2'-5' RNA ligase